MKDLGPPSTWQIQKVADEGTAEPYVARLWFGACEVRDLLLQHQAMGDSDRARRRKDFDDRYSPVLDALGAARKHAQAMQNLLSAHKERVAAGVVTSRERTALHISETIGLELQEHLAAFLSAAARATKLLQELLAYLGTDIGYLFQKDSSLVTALERLRAKGDTELADYLASTRSGWSQVLVQRRNALEHKGWRLPEVRYVEQPDGSVRVVEPEVDGRPVSDYAAYMLGHLLGFVEDMLALCVQRGIADVGDLIDIPRDKRNPSNVKRFQFGVPALQPHERFWRLRYTEGGFYLS